MDSLALPLIAIFVFIAGVLLGWFVGSRPIADWRSRFEVRDGEAKAREETVKAMTVDLATMSERAKAVEQLAGELAAIRQERDTLATGLAAASERAADADRLRADLATTRAEREALREELARLKADADNFSEQKRLLIEAQEALKKEFENAGTKVLEKAQEAFLARAGARFEESEKTSAERITRILAPVGEQLKKYEQQVQELEAKRVDGFGQLTGLLHSMREGQEAVRAAAAQLGNSLRNAPKARGRWGEQQLRNVLEQCGLSEHTDFVTEHSIDTEDGKLRPDAIVRIPGNKLLVIDAKVSLNDYQDAFEAPDDVTREAFLDRHLTSMKTHIQTLSSKSYQGQFADTPDYVIMFVPGEHFIAAAMEHDSKRRKVSLQLEVQQTVTDLWNYAFERRVLLASPTTLVGIARTIAQVWQQEGLTKEAREIGKIASDLYDSLGKTQTNLASLGANLGRAVNSFNDFAKTYDGNVLSRARRLKEKHIKSKKYDVSDEITLIEASPTFSGTSASALPEPEPEES